MELVLKIIFAGFLVIISLLALKKDIIKLTEEIKVKPLNLIVELLLIIGFILLVIGLVIFESLWLGGIAISLIIIGTIYNFTCNWMSNRKKSFQFFLLLLLLIFTFYIFFVH